MLEGCAAPMGDLLPEAAFPQALAAVHPQRLRRREIKTYRVLLRADPLALGCAGAPSDPIQLGFEPHPVKDFHK